ncbi:MAG: hypothetical protein AMXMBFR61_20040 [Fimbriimonadales bacterium]
MAVERVVSGGQTGADRGGLDAAIELGISHGGWCPAGRLAEDGTIPERYELTETDSADFAVRTERNVIDSDGTVLFTYGEPVGGSALTVELASVHDKPLLHLDLEEVGVESAAAQLAVWVAQNDVRVLNVAGSRESQAPGIAEAVREVLLTALRGDWQEL